MARINLPPLTRGLLLTVLALSTLNAILRTRNWTSSLDRAPHALAATNYLTSPRWAVPYLVAIPTKSIRYPWTLLTGALIENNAVSLAVSGCVIYFVGRYLERAWGSNEYAKFVVFVAIVPNVAAFCLYGLWHAVTGHTPELYAYPPSPETRFESRRRDVLAHAERLTLILAVPHR
jgi:membrane associated rhomboid family serine protease